MRSYLPFRVPRGELPGFLEELRQHARARLQRDVAPQGGGSRVATVQDADVELIGAANTLIRTEDGWHAYNTDGEAAIESLRPTCPWMNPAFPHRSPIARS